MTPLSLTQLQLSVGSLFNNTASSETSSNSLNTDILNAIKDEYLSSPSPLEAAKAGLSGLYNAQGTTLQSLLGSQETSDTLNLLSTGLSSQEQSVLSLLSADSAMNEKDKYKVLLAINRATVDNPLLLLSGQDSSVGDMLDVFA